MGAIELPLQTKYYKIMKSLILRVIIDVIGVSCFIAITLIIAYISINTILNESQSYAKTVACGMLVLSVLFAFLDVRMILSEIESIKEDYQR